MTKKQQQIANDRRLIAEWLKTNQPTRKRTKYTPQERKAAIDLLKLAGLRT